MKKLAVGSCCWWLLKTYKQTKIKQFFFVPRCAFLYAVSCYIRYTYPNYIRYKRHYFYLPVPFQLSKICVRLNKKKLSFYFHKMKILKSNIFYVFCILLSGLIGTVSASTALYPGVFNGDEITVLSYQVIFSFLLIVFWLFIRKCFYAF